MKRLILLIGASGSGKSAVAERLGCRVIDSYTTRPKRHTGETGHIFIDQAEVYYTQVFQDNKLTETTIGLRYDGQDVPDTDIIAYMELYGHKYWATKDQVKDGDNVYIIDPVGAEQVQGYYRDSDDVEVITFYLQADENIRAKRLTSRVKDKSILDYYNENNYKEIDEIWERIGPDRELFEMVKCDWVIDANKPIDKVVEMVTKVLQYPKPVID